MKFLSYPEWRAIEVERLTALNDEIECKSCEGEGEKDCHCSCGHTHEVECEECDGAGSLAFKKLSPKKADELYVGIEHYEKVVLDEAKDLAEWMVRDVFEVLVDSGFQPWMRPRKGYKQIFLIPYDQRYRA